MILAYLINHKQLYVIVNIRITELNGSMCKS
jgi:hypothetical protein